MATVDLRVELPACSHSFQIQVNSDWTIKDVKAQIHLACKGAPRADGQRLIWRGRFLRDEEVVKDIWKSADDARIVHLSVHPSAWTASPPNQTVSASASSPLLQPPSAAQPQPTPRRDPAAAQRAPQQPIIQYTSPAPLNYILDKHNIAMSVLMHGLRPTQSGLVNPAAEKTLAKNVLQMYGYSWPTILDEEYPESNSSTSGEGVRYERVVIDNQPYLKLATPENTPSPIQLHALKVLSCTFALLPLIPPDPSFFQPVPQYNPQHPAVATTNLNQHLQQLGLPPLRAIQGPNANQNPGEPNLPGVEIRAIPLRALLMPLMMLTFRTFLLVYFFSPSKRPVFGLVISAWIFWEAWGALRNVIGGERPVAAAAAAEAAEQLRPAGGAAGNEPERVIHRRARNGGTDADRANRTFMQRIINELASANLSSEERILNGAPASEPGLVTKTLDFIILFFSTLHPAVWDRRRTALRKREGMLRMEAIVRDTPEDPNATPSIIATRRQTIERHNRRAPFARRYVERVLTTEWADDA